MLKKEINYIAQVFYWIFAIASLAISTTVSATITAQYDQRGFFICFLMVKYQTEIQVT